MASYGWIIDKDHLYDGDVIPDEAGTMGPNDIDPNIASTLENGGGWRFRMHDDDGELYYSGRYIGVFDEDMFGPLEDFGRPNAGATEIRYRRRRGTRYVYEAL